MFLFYIIIYLISSTIFNYGYKVITKNNISDGAITILIEIIASIFCMFIIPLFEIKFPSNFKIYIFLFFAIIFYTLNNRFGTTARKGLEVSTYSILKQLSNVFMVFASVVFFKEAFVLNKFIGALLIILSNIVVFYNKKSLKFNKHLIYGILANVSLSIALLLDVSYSNEFNLAFYIFLIFFIPSILTLLFEKIKFNQIIKEYKNSNKLIIFITGISWAIMMITKLISYKLGSVMMVATLTSLTVILNIIFGYLINKEKDNLLKKILASILIIIGIILIKI